ADPRPPSEERHAMSASEMQPLPAAAAPIPLLPVVPSVLERPVCQKTVDTIRMAVVGYGHWGPNVVRNLHRIDHSQVLSVCDKHAAALRRVSKLYPAVTLTTDVADVLKSPSIDAVAIVTPVWTHFELSKLALMNGKHVFVEKPFTSTIAQAEELIELAARKNLTVMVDHTFLFTGAVRKIRQLIHDGTLGKLYYYDSTRVNLGL